METKIGEVKGYTIFYDSTVKEFRLRDALGEEVGSGKTQDAVEEQAKKLSKQAYKFPIPAVLATYRSAERGKVTSVNLDNRSMRFVYEEKTYYQSHTKIHLGSGDKVFELTHPNEQLLTEIQSRRANIETIDKEIEELVKRFEKPIGLKYFNLKPPF